MPAGVRLQDEAAEDPLLAAEQGLPPDLSLYFRNKLMVGGWVSRGEHPAVMILLISFYPAVSYSTVKCTP
jgi:hypothetical protein